MSTPSPHVAGVLTLDEFVAFSKANPSVLESELLGTTPGRPKPSTAQGSLLDQHLLQENEELRRAYQQRRELNTARSSIAGAPRGPACFVLSRASTRTYGALDLTRCCAASDGYCCELLCCLAWFAGRRYASPTRTPSHSDSQAASPERSLYVLRREREEMQRLLRDQRDARRRNASTWAQCESQNITN